MWFAALNPALLFSLTLWAARVLLTWSDGVLNLFFKPGTGVEFAQFFWSAIRFFSPLGRLLELISSTNFVI
jgi:hypothetical protein